MVPSLLLHAFLAVLANAGVMKRWSNSSFATGNTDPNVTTACTYWANSIASEDTCASLSSYFGITQGQLISWNPSLSSTACSLIVGNSYCVEAPAVKTTTTKSTTTTTSSSTTTTAQTTTSTTGGAPGPTQIGLVANCNAFYLVESGDTCYDIMTSYGNFTLSQFYSWNPAVETSCSGLQPGYYVCVGVVGLSGTTTTPTTMTTTTTASVNGPTPQQTGIVPNCSRERQVPIKIASGNGITLANFYSWNPAVGSSCSSLWLGYYVCVGVSGSATTTTTAKTTTTSNPTTTTAGGPSPTQSVRRHLQQHSHRLLFVPDAGQFKTWNPAVGTGCTNMQAGYYYCMATADLGPQPGTISTCKKYHLVANGDSCWSIEQSAGITAANFNTWNPDVGLSCASLWVGYYVCIGV
ncbi:hypothetical protein PENSUB_7546 [Penicillium subrubescens]|uniref:LysM domain-containing protein n=1 Tax=Penicillium subrubescens TaxID=1316194 RepID=A0A1Q5TL57_9EURO|nr:hypothetical protein PENSUB_7546 [Penicillium subrubescens]